MKKILIQLSLTGLSPLVVLSSAFAFDQADLEQLLTTQDCQECNLIDADLRGANLQDADLQDADLQDAYLRDVNLQDADLRGANLQDVDFGDADLRGADLRGVNLQDAYLRDADLRGADLRGANLRNAELWRANLQDAELEGANLVGASLAKTNFQGANLPGVNLERSRGLENINLVDANLEGAFLKVALMHGANLQGANLERADLAGTRLKGADLRGANLEEAILENVTVEGADLRGANLDGAYLMGDDLQGARLEGAIWFDGSTCRDETCDGRTTPATTWAPFFAEGIDLTEGSPSIVRGLLRESDGALQNLDGSHAGYIDAYTIEGNAGRKIQIDLHSDDFDAHVGILDPDSTQVFHSTQIFPLGDDKKDNKRFIIELDSNGIYQVMISSTGPGEFGRYHLEIRLL